MKVVLTTIGKFHTFDLARHLLKRGMLEKIYTGYPRFKLRNENIPSEFIDSFPYLQGLYMIRGKLGLTSKEFSRELAWWSHLSLDTYASKTLPDCDVFIALSGSGLRTGREAKRRGALYVCDRASTHIRYQSEILLEEYKRLGCVGKMVDPRMIKREELEYDLADIITVPSNVTRQSFIDKGVPEDKVNCIPYGVDLSMFQQTGEPDLDRFDVLFAGSASHRKGITYLLDAFSRLRHPKKQLTFVGTIQDEVRPLIEKHLMNKENIVCFGHCPQARLKEIMSTHHVLVLPSIEEGLAYVQAQAMACGCPVIASTNTGSSNIFEDSKEGFIVPIRDVDAIVDRLQHMVDYPEVRSNLSKAALMRVHSIGGWDSYGDSFMKMLEGKSGKSVS